MHVANEKIGHYPLWSRSSVRLRILLLVCTALVAQGLMKFDFNMAIVCMLNHTDNDAKINLTSAETNSSSKCQYSVTFDNSTNSTARQSIGHGDILWSKTEQAWIFAGFYWGGLLSVILCGHLSNMFGPSKVLLIGTAINVVGSFLTPVVAEQGRAFYWMLIVRFVMGIGQGVVFPTTAAVAGAWFPVIEKSTAVALYTMGNQIATIISMYLSAQLCQIEFLGGWPSIFYIYGAFGAFFCIIWTVCVCDTPNEHKSISAAERKYIMQGSSENQQKSMPIPWRSIMTSLVVWSLVVNTFAQLFITVALTTYLPLYIQLVLKKDLTSNGIMSALPFVSQLVTKLIMAPVADQLKKRTTLSINTITKMSNSFGSFGCAACILAVSFVGCDQSTLAVVFFSLGMGLLSGYVPGFLTSLVSVAPPFTAVINSIAYIFGQIASIIAPYVIAFLTPNETADEWRNVFIVLFVVLVASGIFFHVFGSVHVQSWAQPSMLDEIITTHSSSISTTASSKTTL